MWGHKEAKCALMKMGTIVIQTQTNVAAHGEKDEIQLVGIEVHKASEKITIDTDRVERMGLE